MKKNVCSSNGKYYEKSRNPKRWVKPLLWTVLVAVLVVILCISLFLMHNEKAEKELNDLSARVQTTVPTSEAVTEPTEITTVPTTVPVETTEPVPTVLPQYADLYAQNPEMFGWIRIDGTKIDYPVMHTPQDPQKYLHKNFEQADSYPGVPFIDAGCNPDSQNLLIYGHNMPNGTMFRGLMKYQEKTFWQQHPTITFNTIYEEQEYEVIAAFNDRVYYARETGMFKFYQFIDPETEEEFNSGIAAMKNKALYDTGVTAEYGDQLITLVTCAYHTDHGRFVVVARKK